jgi:hypothetical protein
VSLATVALIVAGLGMLIGMVCAVNRPVATNVAAPGGSTPTGAAEYPETFESGRRRGRCNSAVVRFLRLADGLRQVIGPTAHRCADVAEGLGILK